MIIEKNYSRPRHRQKFSVPSVSRRVLFGALVNYLRVRTHNMNVELERDLQNCAKQLPRLVYPLEYLDETDVH